MVGLLTLGAANLAWLDRYPALTGWLPAGASLGLILIQGRRLLPGVFFGNCFIGLLAFAEPHNAFLMGTGMAMGGLFAWHLLNYHRLFDLAQRRISDVGAMLLVAMTLFSAVGIATGPYFDATEVIASGGHGTSMQAAADPHVGPRSHGSGSLAHAGPALGDDPLMANAKPAHHGASMGPASALANAIGILLVLPLALRGYRWQLPVEVELPGSIAAAWAVLGLLVAVAAGVYGGLLEDRFGLRHGTLLILPPAVWLALKYDLRYTLAGNFLVFLVSGIGTSLGHGPFADHTGGLPLLTVITLLTTLLIAAGRTERKVAEETIRRIATQDQLTGLPNRDALNQRLAQVLSGARRYRRSAAVMFIDLDHFKRVNDSYGHAIGDRLLVEAAGRLARSLRGDSVLARFGGDEFIALVDNVEDPAALSTVGQRMLDALANPIVIDGHECRISCSGGIAIFPADGDDAGDLLKNADIAMYHIKSRGRSGFQFFSDIGRKTDTERHDRRTDQV